MLKQAVSAGALWGHDTIWLHVDMINKQAQALYLGSGFNIKSQDSWYYVLSRKRYLMQKALKQRQSREQAQRQKLNVAGGSVRGSDGVFVWDVQQHVDADSNAVPTRSSDADPQ